MKKEFTDRMSSMLGEEYPDFENELLKNESHTALRIERGEVDTSEMVRVQWCKNGYYIDKTEINGNHPLHIGGAVYFQEPSAMAVCTALDIKPGDRVLDLCAAPGGKATQAGCALKGSGILIANEIIPKRAAILAENIERMGISNAIVSNESPEHLAHKFNNFFNKIIVDAPCSGEGMFRKEPVAEAEWSTEHTLSCAIRQKKILESAIKMLAPGGRLVYSTCTFAPCENEGVIDYILDKYSELSLVDTGLSTLSAGVAEWTNSSHDLSYARRIYPHIHKGEGHFLALLEKSGDVTLKETPVENHPAPALFSEFQKYLNITLDGDFRMFGENLYLVPLGLSLDKIKVVRGGFYLGVCKKNRFEPSHALALAFDAKAFKNVLFLDRSSDELSHYLHGETIPCDFDGWGVVNSCGVNLGWGKGVDGSLKNHFPKYLRY